MNPSDQELDKAVEILKSGGVVGMPTETVYGLAADIKNPKGINAIFTTKKRPFFDPLIVHIGHMVQIKTVVSEFENLPQFLGERFWPGPLTMILPKSKNLNPKITSSLETVGVRFPKHSVAQKLINKLKSPLAAPSANLFGKTSPTTAEHVRKEFPEVYVLEGGASEVGLESTVIGFDANYSSIQIYRPGLITAEDLANQLKDFTSTIPITFAASKVAPGNLEHHYMPKIPLVVLGNQKIEDLQTELTQKLKLKAWKPAELVLNSNPTLAARELYQKMREISQSGATLMYVRKSQNEDGIWKAIWDRIFKAASLKLESPC